MLSVKSIGAANSGVSEYYQQMAKDDYYSQGQEPPGHWHGKLAQTLDLSGAVRSSQLKGLFEGYHPDTHEPLVPNAGDEHKVGWDLTFSAPKSVSVIWAIADEPHRVSVAHAHASAVTAALDYLQSRAFSSRDRHPGNHLQGILAATFEHGCSREHDPQLHTHCVVANLSARIDGTYGAVDFDSRWKMAAGAVYRAQLAYQLKELGYAIERDGKCFKLAGINEKVCAHFSTRRQQIEAELDKTGNAGATASAMAALSTRKAKTEVDRNTLHQDWQARASALGLEFGQVYEQSQPGLNLSVSEPAPSGIDVHAIVAKLMESASTFTLMQLEAAIAIEAQGIFSAVQIESVMASSLLELLADSSPRGLVLLQDHDHGSRRSMVRYTTIEMLELESSTLKDAQARSIEKSHCASCLTVLADYSTLSSEQLAALQCMTEDAGAVKIVEGLAGTGKSFLLRAAAQAWQQSGLTVIGAALAGKAADSLEQGSGIHSQTLHSLLAELDEGKRSLLSRQVIVLDEAGMVGTRQMARLLDRIHQAGAKAVLVGDSMQLQPIDAGGMFRKLSSELGHASLTDIRRQEKSQDRQMIHDLIAGLSGDVVDQLAAQGQLKSVPAADIGAEMVKQWNSLRSQEQPHETGMLAGTRSEVRMLNKLARESLKLQHRLHSEITLDTENGEKQFAIGERIVFTRNNRSLAVKNGQTGTLTAWHIGAQGQIHLTIESDAGQGVQFDLDDYRHFDHGYALSVHKAQGQTLDNVLVLMSQSMTDRQWSYVAASRHRKEFRMFVPTELSEELAQKLARSRQKEVALDYSMASSPWQSSEKLADLACECEMAL